MKKILIVISALIVAFLATWGVCETAHSDYYNYLGYITDVRENDNGETVIEAISGSYTSEFIVKWYTRKSAPTKQPFGIGDKVMLTTTHYSDKNIKKIKVTPGYSTEGKLVYADGLSCPFIL